MRCYNNHLNQYLQLITAAFISGSIWQAIPAIAQNVQAVQITNQVTFFYSAEGRRNGGTTINGVSTQAGFSVTKLVDPLGQVTGCAGEQIEDYTGFNVGLYEVNSADPTGTEIRSPLALSPTELPDLSGNNVPLGLKPNIENSNPFFLTNGNQGRYNFLLDPSKGQLVAGRTYILLISPPPSSIYSERRIKLTIGSQIGEVVSYTATSLDGRPISTTDNQTSATGTINIDNAERIGLSLAILDLNTTICQSQEIQIIKTGDRASAAPADTVIYRLSVKNLASTPLTNVVITDILPLGFNFNTETVRAELGGKSVVITSSHTERTITFRAKGVNLPAKNSPEGQQVLNIAYAAVLTPDAIRGNGQNSAIASAQRDNNFTVKDGPATHKLRVNSGILTDAGTIIGRVFVDKNFDGEQQRGEPGVPNAVCLWTTATGLRPIKMDYFL
ncbi:DUF11 domain-containing protein [Chlorogloea sp. CCALA 695]|uniref:DUF11 domain-containing protein n=1 Tax=Chlorogloea sp. CCALA 695 TaxID=2107693 RepID=UPI0018ED3B12|nr:DUF11 domain-containing protein [Chlorogloea sp. CCALA 695]